ncbi:unnamed protein product [Tuber melanosporum]|uniref:(Perigord truffle) hypothetical protein n=1 Tax=Tuber melanosporum (strain Mel28) TaxID=656061 RepID=D5GGS0_TUBMM|nr:uncharacterized protein GSTUM_00007488001 [Tuber melanosporum]CAZ83692.1 unnamed protein product [Tuber melanosporum]
MSHSSDEFDDELPDMKKLLERYAAPVQARGESASPLELFDPVTPPKASKTRASKAAVVGGTAKKAAIGIVGGPGDGQGSAKTPVTAIRKPRTVSKLLNGDPEVVVKKKKLGRSVSGKFKGALVEGTNATGRSIEPTKTKGLGSSFRERSTVPPAILDSSDSEEERAGKSRAPLPPPAFTKYRRSRKTVLSSDDEFTPEEDSEEEVEQLGIKKLQRLTIDLTSSSDSEGEGSKQSTASSTRRTEASSEDEGFKSHGSSKSFKLPTEAILSSPPRSTKPCKVFRPTRPTQNTSATPKLDPPKKIAPVIPPSPHHPTSDLFWDERETSSWIDTHSPQKRPPAQRSLFQTPNLMMPEGTIAPLTPSTMDLKEKRALKKSFDAKKKALAEEFLKKVDDKIANGEVGSKCANTGGVQIIWSKTLRTTAGMAKWKVEKLRLPDGHVAMGGHELADRVRHHATIELSVKVVDNEEKLYNVLCHEWAAQCTHAFSHLGVKVTTTHSYEIECKYQWTCQNLQCKYIYMRHSQSIDPEKHSCGACTSGRLLQTQPVPKVKRPITGYQAFMKENFSRIKAENPGKPQKELMGLVGKEYREAKAKDEDAKKGSGFVEAGEKEGVLEELLWGLEV